MEATMKFTALLLLAFLFLLDQIIALRHALETVEVCL